ncbi:MAG: pilus assembly protein TadG-related protein [Acidimicrobiales bacterium]
MTARSHVDLPPERAVEDPRGRGDSGQVTAFVTIIVVAIIFVAGLVLDGGNLLAARREASNEADAAARAGAQAVDLDALRADSKECKPLLLSQDAASDAVRKYATFLPGGHTVRSVVVAGDTVTVTIDIDQQLYILSLAGNRFRTVSATASARIVRGVKGPETGTQAVPECVTPP